MRTTEDRTEGGEQLEQPAAPPESARYEIVVKGHLDARWARQFGGLALTNLPGERTLLAGPLPDQPALHGVLSRIRDLSLTLISVLRCENEQQT